MPKSMSRKSYGPKVSSEKYVEAIEKYNRKMKVRKHEVNRTPSGVAAAFDTKYYGYAKRPRLKINQGK